MQKPPASRFRSAFVGRAVLAVSIVACAGGLLMASMGGMPHTAKTRAHQLAQASPPALASVLPLLNLDSVSLAAANIPQGSVAGVHAEVGARLTNGWATLQSLLAARDNAHAQAGRSPVQGFGDNTPTVVQLRQAAADAQSAVSGWLEEVRQAAIAGLSADQRTALNRLYANRTSSLPIEFRFVPYTQSELVKLRDALSQRVQAVRLNERLDEASTSLIGQYETAAVLAARIRAEAASNQ